MKYHISHLSFRNDKKRDREADSCLKKLWEWDEAAISLACPYDNNWSWPHQLVALKHPKEVRENENSAKSCLILVFSKVWFFLFIFILCVCWTAHVRAKPNTLTLPFFRKFAYILLSQHRGISICLSEKVINFILKIPTLTSPISTALQKTVLNQTQQHTFYKTSCRTSS